MPMIASGAVILTLIIFFIDLMLPLGVAAGVPYVAVALMGVWLPSRRHMVLIAVFTSVATIAGHFLSPASGGEWMDVPNRAFALFAIWICTLIMTLRKEAQYELVMENHRAEDYLEISESIIVHLDRQGLIRLINQHGCEALGYGPEELIGQSWADVFVSQEHRETINKVHQQMLSGENHEFEYFESEVTTKSGDKRHFAWHSKVEYNKRREPLGTLSAGHDITSLKRVERQLRHAHGELEQRVVARTRELNIEKERAQLANRSKTEFLNITSHELRTPLNAIIGFSGMMTSQVFGKMANVKYEGYAKDILNSGRYLLEIINDILDVSKIEANEIALEEDTIDLSKDLKTCVKMIEEKAVDADISLVMTIAEDLPLLKGDMRRVKQIVVNLLSNSVKFTPKGGKVELRCLVVDGRIQIQVKDSGIGISEQNQKTVFDPFFKVENSYISTHNGTGLGLPLVKALTELHGGVIDLESKDAQGTKVTITFPHARSMALNGSSPAVLLS